MTDVNFSKLLPFTWRGRHYPIFAIRFALAHDLVEHKYWGVDGGRVEDTGVAPIRIEARIPIANSIFPGPNEKWRAGELYPAALRAFFVDFANRRTGLLGHPEWGQLTVRAEKAEFELNGAMQGATEIKASWIETIDESVQAIVRLSPVLDIEQAAVNLDAHLKRPDLVAKIPRRPKFKEDFETLSRRIRSVADRISLFSYRKAGMVNRIIYQARALKFSVERARDAELHPVMRDLEIVEASGYALRNSVLSNAGIGLYTVPSDTTLAGVASALPKGTQMGDVIKMNPNLVRSPVVRKDAVVRYPLAS